MDVINENGEVVLSVRKVKKDIFHIETFDIIEGEPTQITVSFTEEKIKEFIQNLENFVYGV